jgi:hypothetical protein
MIFMLCSFSGCFKLFTKKIKKEAKPEQEHEDCGPWVMMCCSFGQTLVFWRKNIVKFWVLCCIVGQVFTNIQRITVPLSSGSNGPKRISMQKDRV